MGEGALHPGTIALIYKRLIHAAFAKKLLGAMSDAELERWVMAVSSHSIRVGVAQDKFAAGEGLPAIMQAYRWRDANTVMRYGAKLAAKSGRARGWRSGSRRKSCNPASLSTDQFKMCIATQVKV